MRTLLLAAAAAAFLPLAANAGCLTGAVIGGVAGHVAGGHGVAGAGAGCVVAHEHDKHEKENAAKSDARGGGNTQPLPPQQQ